MRLEYALELGTSSIGNIPLKVNGRELCLNVDHIFYTAIEKVSEEYLSKIKGKDKKTFSYTVGYVVDYIQEVYKNNLKSLTDKVVNKFNSNGSNLNTNDISKEFYKVSEEFLHEIFQKVYDYYTQNKSVISEEISKINKWHYGFPALSVIAGSSFVSSLLGLIFHTIYMSLGSIPIFVVSLLGIKKILSTDTSHDTLEKLKEEILRTEVK